GSNSGPDHAGVAVLPLPLQPQSLPPLQPQPPVPLQPQSGPQSPQPAPMGAAYCGIAPSVNAASGGRCALSGPALGIASSWAWSHKGMAPAAASGAAWDDGDPPSVVSTSGFRPRVARPGAGRISPGPSGRSAGGIQPATAASAPRPMAA